jgi:hypothetical protein
MSTQTYDTAARALQPNTSKPAPKGLAPASLFAFGLIDQAKNLLLGAYDGVLKVMGKPGKYTSLVFTQATANRTVTFPNGSGTVSLHAKAALTPASTVSFAPGSSVSAYTLTPGQNETINAVTTGAIAGRLYGLVITTSGTTSYTLTFGTAFKTTATLATGTTSGKVFVMIFLFDGTNFIEASRTTAM